MTTEARNAVTGLVALLALVVMGYGMYLYLGGFFKPGFEVVGQFERAGQLLRGGSDVKLRGVLVGEVTDITVMDTGQARVAMRMFPDQQIPENVQAGIRAKTLFGEKFIDLRTPEEPSVRNLSEGDVIPEERTTGPFEVETILEKLVPVLEAIDPELAAAAFDALAKGFVGNEQALRRATLQGERALIGTQHTLPNLERNLVHLRDFAAAMDAADTDLLRALDGLEAAGRPISRRAPQVRRTLGSLAAVTGDVADILEARERDLGDLAAQGAPILELVASKAPELPDILRALDGFLGAWILSLSEGPYWRITFTSEPVNDQPPYPPGAEPSPRSSQVAVAERDDALRTLNGDVTSPPSAVTDILLAPVPDEGLNGLLDRLGLRNQVPLP